MTSQPCIASIQLPFGSVANETLGGKRYWSPLQPAPPPNAVVLVL